MKRVTLIAVLALATIGLVGIFATNVYAHPGYAAPCVTSGCHVTPPAGDPSLIETTQTVIPTGTVDTTCSVTVSDIESSYRGDALIKLTATDKPGGWGVGYIYYSLDGDPVRLIRVPVDWAISEGAMSCETTIPVPAPATGQVAHTISFWSQDNYGIVEAPTTVSFTVVSAAKLPTTTTLRCSATTITRGGYVTLTAQLKGGSDYTNEYLRFEVYAAGMPAYKVYRTVKVSPTGYATYRYRILTRGTRYHRVRFLGSDTYLPAPLQHGIKLIVR